MYWKTAIYRAKYAAIVASALFTLAFVSLLARSYWASDRVCFTSPAGESYIYTCSGGVGVFTQPSALPWGWSWEEAQFGGKAIPYVAGLSPGREVFLGIQRNSYFTSMAQYAWAIVVPFWLLVVASALPCIFLVVAGLLLPVGRRRVGRGFPVVPR